MSAPPSIFARLAPRLQEAIAARLGWTQLRPVQEQAGEALLAGDNAVILAPTAGGKTEASIFPLLSGLVNDPPAGLGVLYIAPIKALLNNQAERLGQYTEMVGLRRFVWHGDTPSHRRQTFLADPAELLMTTPESLEVMLISQKVDRVRLFGDLRAVIIDEVHAVAGTDRGAHLSSVLERIARHSRHDLQRVGLSATIGNPPAILRWLCGTSRRASRVVDPPREPQPRQLLVVHRPDLARLARDAAQLAKGHKSLFFCQSRATTEVLAEHLRRAGTDVFVHHSAVSREERQLAEERFYRGADACIVCTSTLELGIDVGDLDKVLQAEAPDTVSSFLQRMGRTGRRPGRPANTTFFCETTDGLLQAAALIELARSGWVEEVEIGARCWPVLIHQLLALSLAGGGVTLEDAWAHLSTVPDLQGVHRAEYERLIRWMLKDGSLVLTAGRLVLGPKAERRFGHKNFMDLYAVFSSPQTYAVQTVAAQPLGTLNQSFVDRLVEGISCFLLGGRAWVVLQVLHSDRVVKVEPAPQGRQPTWGGFLPQLLGREVCQRILRLLTAEVPLPYLNSEAAAALEQRRQQVRGFLQPEVGGIEVAPGELRWWTFAGGRINATLRYALEAVGGDWKVIPDNFLIKIRGESADEPRLRAAIERLRDLEFWENDKLWAEVAESLPSYRLSKFQMMMPPWIEREVVAGFLLDVAGAWRWLSGLPAAALQRVPAGARALTVADQAVIDALTGVESMETPSPREPGRSLRWITTDEALVSACAELRAAPVIGLDVETSLWTRALCLVQIATPTQTYLIDPLEVADLEPLAPVLASRSVIKLIHNAQFERQVLGRQGLAIEGVVDTLEVSRRLRGRKIDGGHSLKAVCAREFDLHLDKTDQTSDWARRPLSESQVVYAALDAEILLRLYAHFTAVAEAQGQQDLGL